MAALRAEVAATRQAMVATQQEMALMAQASPQIQAQPFPAWSPSYQGTYQQHGMPPPVPPTPVPQAAYAAIPPPAPAAYQPATAYQPAQAYVPPIGGGGGRACRGEGSGGGRGGQPGQPRCNQDQNRAEYGVAPPAAGGAQPAVQAATTGQKNYTKYFNNWNMCFSCGFDVPGWHTSATCLAVCRKDGHQEGCNRQNYAQYAAQGHKWSYFW